MTIEIEKLDIQLEVDSESDEQVFVGLFNRYIQQWMQAQAEAKQLQQELDSDRMLVDETMPGANKW